MNWPLPQDFNEAIQNPAAAFSDPDLRDGETVTGPTGVPLPLSGNFAEVYQLCGPDGRNWAVKCFTRPVSGLAQRYAQIAITLAQAGFPFTVQFTYLTEGIRVRGAWRPVIKMEWVEGTLLNEVVELNAGQPNRLATLAQLWTRLSRKFRDQGVAHADIQHGNVLLVPGSRAGASELKLIDYDGMYTPTLAHSPSGESGHPNYQHPLRGPSRAYSPDLDRFPNLVVVTALKALEVLGPGLWQRYDTGDNLLFVESDFKKPWASRLMRELWESGNEPIRALVGHLVVACGRPINQTPWLDEIALEGHPRPLDPATAREAAERLGISHPNVAPPFLAPAPAAVPPPVSVPGPVPVRVPAPVRAVVGVEVVEEEPAPARSKKRTGEREEQQEERPSRRSGGKRGPRRRRSRGAKRSLLLGVLAVILLVPAAIIGVLVVISKQQPQQTAPEGPPTLAKGSGGQQVAEGPPQSTTPEQPVATGPPNPGPANPPARREPLTVEAPREAPELPKRWERKFAKWPLAGLVIDAPSETLFWWNPADSEFLAFDLRTGARRPGYAGLAREVGTGFANRVVGIFPLDDGLVGTLVRSESSIRFWDARTGQPAGSYALPADFRVPNITLSAYVAISPNRRYVVTAGDNSWSSSSPVPFRLLDTTTGRTVLTTDWWPESVHFTSDSSRALVTEWNGRCQWYRLPGGEPDGGWTYGHPEVRGMQSYPSLSEDGRLLTYTGPGPSQGAFMPMLLDARSGSVLRRYSGAYHAIRAPTLSRDGRVLVAPLFPRVLGWPSGLDVIEVATGRNLGRVNAPYSDRTYALSQDGRTLAYFQNDLQDLRVYDIPIVP